MARPPGRCASSTGRDETAARTRCPDVAYSCGLQLYYGWLHSVDKLQFVEALPGVARAYMLAPWTEALAAAAIASADLQHATEELLHTLWCRWPLECAWEVVRNDTLCTFLGCLTCWQSPRFSGPLVLVWFARQLQAGVRIDTGFRQMLAGEILRALPPRRGDVVTDWALRFHLQVLAPCNPTQRASLVDTVVEFQASYALWETYLAHEQMAKELPDGDAKRGGIDVACAALQQLCRWTTDRALLLKIAALRDVVHIDPDIRTTAVGEYARLTGSAEWGKIVFDLCAPTGSPADGHVLSFLQAESFGIDRTDMQPSATGPPLWGEYRWGAILRYLEGTACLPRKTFAVVRWAGEIFDDDCRHLHLPATLDEGHSQLTESPLTVRVQQMSGRVVSLFTLTTSSLVSDVLAACVPLVPALSTASLRRDAKVMHGYEVLELPERLGRLLDHSAERDGELNLTLVVVDTRGTPCKLRNRKIEDVAKQAPCTKGQSSD